MTDTLTSAAKPNPGRAFGRFQLRQLLGKSDASMAWLALDPQTEQEVLLHMPRVQPADALALETWLQQARQAVRLNHPHLGQVVEVATHDHWPYLAVDRILGQTLEEWMVSNPKPTPGEVVDLICQSLEGLAYAHEAGVIHGDLQLHHLLVNERGHVSVVGFDIATESENKVGARRPPDNAQGKAIERGMAIDPRHLRARRDAAERDVLAVGLLMHHLLTGQPAFDQSDTARAIDRLPPEGRDILRLTWSTPYPISEALRAIANRATDRQPRRRYLNARTLLQALKGWREADAKDSGGPVALLLSRLQTVGHLPALPEVKMIVARLTRLEDQRIDEIAEEILKDLALSFELLRQANSAQVQGAQISGSGAVLTIRRTVALVGMIGVHRAAASLRAWPGPLNEVNAAALNRLMQRVRMAGHTAQALRPAGYDAEVIYLITLLQNIGRLMLQYHFPDEAEQVSGLMQAAAPIEPGGPELPGMSEEDASYAVLGVDVETLGAAVARHWGLADEVIHMIRRLGTSRPVRTPDGDADLLRTAASAANEAVDAITLLPAQKVPAALANVAQRYARALGTSTKDLADALQGARMALDSGVAVAPALRGAPSAQSARDEGSGPGPVVFAEMQATPSRSVA